MITWFRHRRTSGICEKLGIELEELVTERTGAMRFAELTLRTVRLLVSRRPAVVLVQNPSLVGTLVTLGTARLLRIPVVVDAHNEAVQPFVHNSKYVVAASRWALRRAQLTVVTNGALADEVRGLGGESFVLPDAIPAVPAHATGAASATNEEQPVALVIATGAPDEPIGAIVEVARTMPHVNFKITGREGSIRRTAGTDLPPNILLTGFVDEGSYWNLLMTSTLVVDLTLMEDCLVCGAYEAIAVETPLVLSDNAASRELFGAVARLVKNEPADIAAGIEDTLTRIDDILDRMSQFRPDYIERWDATGQQLKARLAQLAG